MLGSIDSAIKIANMALESVPHIPILDLAEGILNILCETRGDNAGIYYFGLLMSKMDKSRKQIKQSMKTHPRSLDRKLKKIVDAGIPLTLTDREEPLPPLSINPGA